MLIVIILVILLFGGFGGYHTYRNENFGPVWGGGIGLGTVLLVILILYVLGPLGAIHFPR